MFNSAKGRIPVIEDVASTSTNYSTFQAFEDLHREDISSDESDKTGSDIEITGEIVRTKKQKKEKKHKKNKKQTKERKRKRRSSSSSDIIECPPAKVRDVEEERVDNYTFTQNVKKYGLPVSSQAFISLKHPRSVIDNLYPGQYYDNSDRYFSSKVTGNTVSVATERVFTPRLYDYSATYIPLSTTPADEETWRSEVLKDFQSDMSSEEFDALMESKMVGYDNLSPDEQRMLVRASLKKDERSRKAWERFLEFEEKLITERIKNSAGSSAVMMIPHYERKVEILKEAISKVRKPDKLYFNLLLLETTVKWKGINDESVTTLWNKIQSLNPNEPDVSRFMIKRNINHLSTFLYKMGLSAYEKMFYQMMNIYSGSFVSHRPVASTASFILELMNNRCRFLIESGYVHLAVASLQCALEFLCFCPARLQNIKDKIAAFSKFWKSGAPRIGDSNAKGWKDTKLEEIDLKMYMSEEKLSTNMEYEELTRKERGIIGAVNIDRSSGLSFFWHEFEKTRMSYFWRPLRVPNAAREFEGEFRFVSFDEIAILLRDYGDLNVEEIVFSLLRVFGVIDPLGEEDTQQNAFYNYLPQMKFTRLLPDENFSEFVSNLLILLAKSPHVDTTRCLVALVKTTERRLLQTETITTEAIKVIKELHKKLPTISQISSHIAFFHILDALAAFSHLPSQYAGVTLAEYDKDEAHVKRKKNVITSFLTYLNQNPFSMAKDVQQQLILEAVFRCCVKLPSRNSKGNSEINRLRLLTFLVLGKIKHFLDVKTVLTKSDIQKATEIWNTNFKSFMEVEAESQEKCLDNVSTIFFKLFNIFAYESTGECLFANSAYDEFSTNDVHRVNFRLDFTKELMENNLIDLKMYTLMVENAMKQYSTDLHVQKHFMAVLSYKSCHTLGLIKFEYKDITLRNQMVLCRIAAVQKKILNIKDTPDTRPIVDAYKKWLRTFIQESLEMLTDTIVPETFIWRYLIAIELERKQYLAAERLYTESMINCPYGKSLVMFATQNVHAPDKLVLTNQNLAEKTHITLHTLPEEAQIARDEMMRRPH
ncbi:unnamed protein product [Bursaphelenchus okinawaensis]|uniref:Uncharacterized protein n=1 Tax=Bursaphelenchus okinawaensis TaxID=465554 RepID=A0A811K5P5_9BILA|nr:unnamed protein product [Bursaphelenchus okinawaensis]CAG9093141.1 unnamed protein product [Bursaphelenchus okinawaensis]